MLKAVRIGSSSFYNQLQIDRIKSIKLANYTRITIKICVTSHP